MGLPVAVFTDDRNDRELILLLATAEDWKLSVDDVVRLERFWRKKHDRKLGRVHRLRDVIIPECTNANLAVLPDIE